MGENPQGTDIYIARQMQKRHLAAIWAGLAGLRPGMVVADIGCGPGILTREYGAMVGPAGVVYAVDKKLTYKALVANYQNVHFLFQNYDSKIKLEQTPHIVFLTDRLQHDAQPEILLQSVFKACGPETKCLITGYDPKAAGRFGTKLHLRMPAEKLSALAEAAGFRHGGIIDSADEHYALIVHR